MTTARRLLMRLLTLTVLAGVPSAAFAALPQERGDFAPQAQQQDALPRSYRVFDVTTREQRSAIARTGAAIEHAAANQVDIVATPQEAARISALGFRVEELARMFHFPSADPPTTTMPRWRRDPERRQRQPVDRQPLQHRQLL